MTSERRLTS